MKIEAGKKYITRGGRVVTVELVEYPFEGDNDESYTPDGKYHPGQEDIDDLVEEYVPEPPVLTLNERYGEPEPGWRWLDDDEKVEKGDEFENNGKFTPSGNYRLDGRQDENAKPYRRRVTPPSIKLRHGRTYLTRGGSTVTVERVPDNVVFTFKSWQDTYTSDGRTHLGFSHDNDIVKELDPFHPKDVAAPVEPVKPEPESVVLYKCLCRYGDLWQIEWVSDTTLRGVQWQQDKSNPGYMISTTCPDEVLRTGESQWVDLAGLRRDQPKV